MLTTLARAKQMLGVPADDTADDFALQLALAAASRAIEREMNRQLGRQVHTEVVDGSGRRFLRLRHYPINRVDSVTIGGAAATDYETESYSGMLLHPGCWPEGLRNVVVTYEAGYDLPTDDNPGTLPENYELACILYAQTLMREQGTVSERVGDIAVTYEAQTAGRLPGAVAALIAG